MKQWWLTLLRDAPHPWWHHLPPERRRKRERLRLQSRRFRAWLSQRRQLIGLTVAFYLLCCVAPLALGLSLLAVVALLPLLLVPPVGLLVYWLVWQEFHH